MNWRAPAVCGAAAVLVSCALLSGAADLTIGEPNVAPDDAAPTEDVFVGIDAQPDAAADADAGPPRALCDEPGLVARWTFDEAPGPDVLDCTHFRNDGRNDGGMRTLDRDGGMAFDGGWVGFGNPSSLRLTAALTACAWIRPASFPAAEPGRGYVVGRLTNPSGGGWRMAVGPGAGAGNGRLSMNVPNGDGGIGDTSGGMLGAGTWQHICMVFEPSTQRVLLDGKRVAEDDTPFPAITLTNDELRVGARSDGTNAFRGVVDDVRIYSRALSDAEIAALAVP